MSRIESITRDNVEEQEATALLGLHLTPFHWRVLYLLLAHPLLSDEEVASLLGLQRRSIRCALSALHTLGCLELLSTPAGRRWHLCERRLRLVAAASHLHIRTIVLWPGDEAERETSTMMQRGEGWLVQHIQHAAGIYSFFASLAQAARQQPEQALCWWETGAMCERRYRVHEQWFNLRPDALAEYRVEQSPLRFWLEWDCGTMNMGAIWPSSLPHTHTISPRVSGHESTRGCRGSSVSHRILLRSGEYSE